MGEDRLLGRWDRIVRGTVLDGTDDEAGAATGCTAPVAGLVRHDSEQPRSKRQAGPKARQGAVCLDEAVLNGILGLVRAADQARRTKRQVLIGAHQLLIRGDIAAARSLDQLQFVQWPALHRATVLHRWPRLGSIPARKIERSRPSTCQEGCRPGSDASGLALEGQVVWRTQSLSAARAEDRRSRFDQFARQQVDGSYRLAVVLLGDPHDAQDATHDALLRAWQHWPDLRDEARFDAWFQRILVNECRNRLRRRRSPVRAIAVDEQLSDAASPEDFVD